MFCLLWVEAGNLVSIQGLPGVPRTLPWGTQDLTLGCPGPPGGSQDLSLGLPGPCIGVPRTTLGYPGTVQGLIGGGEHTKLSGATNAKAQFPLEKQQGTSLSHIYTIPSAQPDWQKGGS